MPRQELGEIFASASSGPAPAGVRIGDVIFCGNVGGTDPDSGVLPEAIESQVQNVFRNMRELVGRAGGTLDNIARVDLFMRQLSDLPALNRHWVEMFPNAEDRPTYKFLQTDPGPGRQLAIDFFAVAGARRRLLAIPGVAHSNPIPLAVKIGPMLFSSRILPADVEKGQYGDTAERQAELSFQHARRLLELAGGGPEHISQIRAFVREPEFRAAIDEQVGRMFPIGSRPRIDVLHYPTAGPLAAMIEIVATELPL